LLRQTGIVRVRLGISAGHAQTESRDGGEDQIFIVVCPDIDLPGVADRLGCLAPTRA
jgi:hypothetical protein